MRDYRIRITGEYDVLVVSPRMLERLIARIRQSDSRELVIPAEEILPPGYTDYLARVLEANGEQDGAKSGQNVYDVLAGQIENLKVEEDPCFDRVEAEFPGKIPGAGPQFDVEAREQFFLFTKQKNTVFRYVFANEDGEEASVLLEYLSY